MNNCAGLCEQRLQGPVGPCPVDGDRVGLAGLAGAQARPSQDGRAWLLWISNVQTSRVELFCLWLVVSECVKFGWLKMHDVEVLSVSRHNLVHISWVCTGTPGRAHGAPTLTPIDMTDDISSCLTNVIDLVLWSVEAR